MYISPHDRALLTNLIESNEERLIELILDYADLHQFTRYTSTLKEAWRLSIEGLSQALVEIAQRCESIPELGPDEDYTADPATRFGTREAQKHRARGVNLSMFLGLMKYYRQSYLDLLDTASDFEQPKAAALLVNRFFDRTELAYCSEWVGIGPESQIKELSDSNLLLANEKNKYLTLFESLSSPVLLCDANGKLDNFNNAAGELLLDSHTPGSRYYTHSPQDLSPPGLQQELAKLMSENDAGLQLEKTYQTTRGERTYDIRIERMLDVSHKFSGYTLLFTDITERLRSARQLEAINDKQQRLIDDLQRMRQQLVQSEKMAAIGQLASGMAHEINTPIQYIRDNLQFLHEAYGDLLAMIQAQQNPPASQQDLPLEDLDFLQEEIPKALEQTLEGTRSIITLVSAMKTFAQPGANEKVDTDINAAIRSTLTVSANQWKYHAVIETDLDDELPYVPAMPMELNQALLNIIVNSATAIEEKSGNGPAMEKGIISLQTRREDDWVVIRISDTGLGIPEAILPKIFDPFFTTREVGKGTGQGLTVAYLAIVNKHAGKIDVHSTPGQGTTFEIRLPIMPGTNESAEQELWRMARSGVR